MANIYTTYIRIQITITNIYITLGSQIIMANIYTTYIRIQITITNIYITLGSQITKLKKTQKEYICIFFYKIRNEDINIARARVAQ
jgi:hypothetical protein